MRSMDHNTSSESAATSSLGFVDEIKRGWCAAGGTSSLQSVMVRVATCAESLQRWNSVKRKSLQKAISLKQEELRTTNLSASIGSWRYIRSVKHELNKLLVEEESYWKQRLSVT
ncbi:hypothetical protein ACOSP7_002347 [Xanthoceras sorbifolium]